MFKEITSINNSFIKELLKLTVKKTRTQEGKFIVEGYHLVEEANKHNSLLMVLSTDKKELEKYSNVDTYLVTNEIIKKLSGTETPQNIIGISSFVHNDNLSNGSKIVFLDNVQDPGNMGTIIRTAAALGYDTIMISDDSCDIYNDKVLRSTQGTIFKINIVINKIDNLIKQLKTNNIPFYVTNLKSDLSIKDLDVTSKFACAFGNEAHGVREITINNATKTFKLEMKNTVESLNVSIASGIILYELNK